MIDIIKKQWFVILIALIFIGFSIFCIYDTNKGKLPGKSVDGKDVVVSLEKENITADELYDEIYKTYGDSVLMNQFNNAVIDEAVKTTDELKETAKQIRTNVETNAQNYASSYQMSSEEYITTMLKQQGYEYEQLDDFCLLAAKMQKMQNDYIDKNFDSLFDDYYKEKQPRTVSHILIKVADVNNPSEEEQKQIDAVNKELKEGKSFEEVAKKYSADGSAENGGSLGLMDTDTQYVESFKKAALGLKSNETSEWVKESNENYSGWHLIKAGKTTKEEIKEEIKKNKDLKDQLYYNIANYHTDITNKMIKEAMENLDIKYSSDDIKKMIDESLNSEN
ncbi:foldase protein PrsA [Amedibacterium intestinale]|uniref:foldase protein PrsA n=1 Tax=Amedibacterium intestinale TaxID=2583452 RepID=UPI000E538EA0|nr:peptidylprolyl isomerase [Amedibacterium intestinale]RHO28146.1 foldase [Erysipelotrichaceae bacterium AM17-60]